MANPVWPPTLPTYVLEQGYEENLPDNNLESQVDSGVPKIRPRYTALMQMFKYTVLMDADQSDTFEAFFNTTLATGSLPFDWVHPRTRVACTFQFRKPVPKATTQGGVNVAWQMNVQLIAKNT